MKSIVIWSELIWSAPGLRADRCRFVARDLLHAAKRVLLGGEIRAYVTGKRVDNRYMFRVLLLGAVLGVAGLVSGCGGGTLSETERQSLAAEAAAPPTLQPADKVNINVFGENQLSGQYTIDRSGQISLPLAGTIKAQGLTQSELEEALAKKFRSRYLRDPKVTVTIVSLAPYYVMGEVKNPGQFEYKSGLNVLTAMAIAGGPTYRASRNSVEIQRRGEVKMQTYPISAAVPVLPGDVIKVPERYF
jgi:hypothetical protein